jgi:inhibitor of KinA
MTYLLVVKDFRIYTLSETALTIAFGDRIDPQANDRVKAMQQALTSQPFPGLRDMVAAYSTLTVYYDPVVLRRHFPGAAAGETLTRLLATVAGEAGPAAPSAEVLMTIPVCYHPSLSPDLEWVAAHCGVDAETVIQWHCSVDYRVYMIGFIPGFPYMGSTIPALRVPRKQRPRARVEEGSVALAGEQTGIYPASVPGGWQLIGRTPCRLFDPAREPSSLLQAGMRVRFSPISLETFNMLVTDGHPHH